MVRAFSLLAAALLPLAAFAGKTEASKSDSWEMPALETASESLWDRVETLDGQPPSPEVVAASNELAEERSAEVRFLDEEGKENLLDALAWYRDPIARLNADPLYLDRIDFKEFDLPIVVNDDVKRWMRYFLGGGRKYYTRYLARSTHYRALIESHLKERGMPLDLFYLSMIESGFSPQAYSPVGAAGLWQFMPATGMAYSLRVDWWMDERRDPERATEAATRHLQDLYRMFGDWYLAAAAYNAGAGRIQRAVAKTGPGDFWHVAKPGVLPSETANYVPKLIAAAIIGHHPNRYGFDGIHYEETLSYDKADVPASTTVEVLARCAKLQEQDFYDLNPALRRWALPPDPSAISVHVPEGAQANFSACMAKVPPAERIAFLRHKVRRGESLGTIARRYDVSSEAIARMNDITNKNRVFVGMELIIPVPPKGATSVASMAGPGEPNVSPAPASTPVSKKVTRSTRTSFHTVRKGENMATIAARYGVSVSDVMAWNGLRNANHIEVGQKLKINESVTTSVARTETAVPRTSTTQASNASTSDPPGRSPPDDPPADPPSSHGQAASSGSATLNYKVQKGDTLSAIASRFHVSVDDLSTWNKIGSSGGIQAGQVLEVEQPKAGWVTYKVQKGDTLGTIAKKYKVATDDIRAWNGMDSSTIYVGQSLKIRK
jgi:membrane-bound lytic murein transglycosylase D